MTDKKKSTNEYDDDNIPEIDLPKQTWATEPLPESTRPRKDGPGGDGTDSAGNYESNTGRNGGNRND